jgi:hypothetical protein
MSQALKQLGFAHVEETAIGAERVTREYEYLIEDGSMPNIIATACPSTVLLIERHFPDLIPFLAPVVSPMVAHARMMREIYGPRIKIVFIGPCIAKKHETIDPGNGSAVFAAMTFEQLADWFAESQIDLSTCPEDESQRMIHNTLPRFYPVPGGIIRNLNQTTAAQIYLLGRRWRRSLPGNPRDLARRTAASPFPGAERLCRFLPRWPGTEKFQTRLFAFTPDHRRPCPAETGACRATDRRNQSPPGSHVPRSVRSFGAA